MNRQEALKAMQDGHKVANHHFSDTEYLYMVGDNIMSEDGYDFNDWFFIIEPGEEWKESNWSIVKICYECGKHLHPED